MMIKNKVYLIKQLQIFIYAAVLIMMGHSLNAGNYINVKTFSEDNFLQMVVEIHAGTNKKIEYDEASDSFEIDKINGVGRIVNFLPYPGNYGFIPSTKMRKDKGGDGDSLDILLISESLDTGTIINVIPIGLMVLQDSNEIDTKIIAIPAEEKLRVINATNYSELQKDYSNLMSIIKIWFINYKRNSFVEFIKWGDEKDAISEIKKWSLK